MVHPDTRTLMANTLDTLDTYGWAAGGLIDMDGKVCLTAAVAVADGLSYRVLEAIGRHSFDFDGLHIANPYLQVARLAALPRNPLTPLLTLAMEHPTWTTKACECHSTGGGLHPVDSLWVVNDSPLTTEEDIRLLVKRAMEA